LGLLTPHFQKVSFKPDAVLVQSGDELDQIYFPNSGAIAFMIDMPDGQTVATTLMGREGALASLSMLVPSRSSVTAIARVAGTASLISAAKFRLAYARSAAIRHVVQVHARSLLLQLQHVAACNVLHLVEGRMARAQNDTLQPSGPNQYRTVNLRKSRPLPLRGSRFTTNSARCRRTQPYELLRIRHVLDRTRTSIRSRSEVETRW
jgi:CRP-like cAMP-binding protein